MSLTNRVIEKPTKSIGAQDDLRRAPGKTPIRLLCLPANAHPCGQAVLEEVLASRLATRGFAVEWVMHTREPDAPSQAKWRASTVHLIAQTNRGLRHRFVTLRKILHGLRIANRQRPDVWFVRNSPWLALAGLCARRTYGSRLVYQVSHPILEKRIAIGRRTKVQWWLAREMQNRVLLLLTRAILRHSDLVIPISDLMAKELEDAGVDPRKVWPLGMGAVEDSRPATRQVTAFRASLGLLERPMVLYFGSMGRTRRLEVLLGAMPHVLTAHPTAVLLMLGATTPAEKQFLVDCARRLGVHEALRFCPPVPRASVPLWVSAADLTVSSIPPEPFFMSSFPTKTIESLACGTPVVVTPIPKQVQLIEAFGGGIAVEFDEASIASGIVRILDDPGAARLDADRARTAVLAEFGYDKLAADLAERLRALLCQEG